MKMTSLTILLAVIALSATALPEQNESPYFIVQTESAREGGFPLVSTSVDATITGPIADVTILQKYRNDSAEPIEALYVFPASTRAAVYHMEMRIGDRTIKAEVQKRDQARQTYERAKSEGKRTSLLEQSRPNVFQMQVANILPGEEIDVALRYTEFILPEDQQYAFVYPTVVGPRYKGAEEQSPVATLVRVPRSSEKELPTYTFNMEVDIRMPVPIAALACPSHRILQNRLNKQEMHVSLDPIETYGGNRDFILTYRLAGDEVLSGVMTYDDGEDGYFLCQVEAPRLGKAEIVPREYIFILDVSGSMNGFPLDVSKELMKNLLADIRPTDRFNVLYFAASSAMQFPQSVPATHQNIAHAFNQFQLIEGGGGTELLAALRRAMAIPKTPGFSRSFVIATDGYVMVEEEAFRYVQTHLDEANFFAFGIGSSVNRFIIEGLAHVGRGEPFIVTKQSEAKDIADKLKVYIEHPVLTDINVHGTDVEFYDVTPQSIPDLMAARPIYCFGKYKAGGRPQITISGRRGAKSFSKTLDIPQPQESNSALTYLWAREKIRLLSDFNAINTSPTRIEEITQLGLDYNLLTKYTSFVAVDEEQVVEEGGVTKQIKQRLPLPQGVSNLAVGFEMELDPVVHGAESLTLTVDVKCQNKDVEVAIDAMLALILQDMEPSGLTGLYGLQVELLLKGSKIQVVSEQELPSGVLQTLRSMWSRLGMASSGTHCITIAIGHPTVAK